MTMNSYTTFPTLYHKGKTGALHSWKVWAKGDEVHTEYGQVGGKMQTSTKKAKPKNVGKSNALTAFEQAAIEAKAMWVYKRDRKYSETPEDAQKPLELPMLAHKFEDKKHKIVYPVNGQPKFDGFRCLATKRDGHVILTSREGEVFNLPHLEGQLRLIMLDDSVLDGELYSHGESFQTICKWIKKYRPETAKINFHCYDVPEWAGNSSQTWEQRHLTLVAQVEPRALETASYSVHIVRSVLLKNEEEVHAYEAECVAAGYEGCMVRTFGGEYEYGYRSSGLLKVKSFVDDEFLVTDCNGGDGKFEYLGVFSCVTKEGVPFDVVPRGTAAVRAEYLAHKDKYIGKYLTVKYFRYTEAGKPYLPVGLHFKPGFDLKGNK